MNRISNIDSIPREYMYDSDFQSKVKTIRIGDAIGAEKIYVNIDYVKPGGESTKYHSHSKQEEFFLIMSGTGILRIDGKEIAVKTGDVISKPSGKNIAHQFLNNSSEILQILDVGTREKGDIATYPDENITFLRDEKLVFNSKDRLENWTSDPNQ
jgi:uncharacterized cupin superfamily protein